MVSSRWAHIWISPEHDHCLADTGWGAARTVTSPHLAAPHPRAYPTGRTAHPAALPDACPLAVAGDRSPQQGHPSAPARTPNSERCSCPYPHTLRQQLIPTCLPVFTSDGLNLYFYALTAHFREWVKGKGRRARHWQVAAGLIYG
jgi:hypothetical protein